jgi:hypothetical protein
MVASLLKVISSGIQDERLDFKHTLYPFYKVWKKAGRFTTQWARLDFENVPQFGNTAYCRLLRKGHLITRLFLVAEMPDIYTAQKNAREISGVDAFPHFGWTNSLGHALIQQLTLDIAADRVETLNSRLLEMLDEYNTPLNKIPVLNDMILRKDNGFTAQSFGNKPELERVVVPLPFWFTRGDSGCALPIDAMIMDETRVGIKFRSLNGSYYSDVHVSGSGGEGSSLWPILGSSFYTSDPSINPNAEKVEGVLMPTNLQLGECYIMAEYVYLDQPEANRFRLADIQMPIVQHYSMDPHSTRGLMNTRINLDIPNPCRDVFFMLNREDAPTYNAYFLATRDLTGNVNTLPSGGQTPWWPDATGLSAKFPGVLRPGFSLSDSEPISGYEVNYEGNIVRFRTESPALFRSIIPSYEQRKSPWINRYYYNIPLGIQNGFTPFSKPQGEANLDKINKRELIIQLRPSRGSVKQTDVPTYIVYVFAETYNILRVYGGRAGLLFAY